MANLDSANEISVAQLGQWQSVITPSIGVLHQLAGTTEDEFLQIGSRLQSLYQRSADISATAGQLVEVVTGEHVVALSQRLQQMMSEMENYLVNARQRSGESCRTLERVELLLNNLSEPLEGFHKMNKTLRMLSISTKIESARLGETGSGFVNLAMDVEKLSHQVNEKSLAILRHRQLLVNMITGNLENVHLSEAEQDDKVHRTLSATAANLKELDAVNKRCSTFGGTVSKISSEITASISDVVASMQMHDMTRQQFEHVVEALERLEVELKNAAAAREGSEEAIRRAVIEAGDVCELQEAQLRFASAELYTAVCTIIDNLRDVARKQSVVAQDTAAITGGGAADGSSFVDEMSQGMVAVTAVLASCAWADSNMAAIMRQVAETISEIAVFVTDIEAIGSEIDLIALNSQIKAALTGTEGAALGVLAEAIKRLSDEAVRQTDSVAATLHEIHGATEHLLTDSANGENELSNSIMIMQEELATILRTMGEMNSEMYSILSGLDQKVASLTQDVEEATDSVDVHQRTKEMSSCVLAELEKIVAESRLIEPASSQFKENLRHMEEHYTMESERHIHEALARKRSGQSAAVTVSAAVTSSNDSEFGDNVDLF